ncbi:Scr1 family TA system antitoxin-like transcriptional regulator [Streptomonospora algeriensis]
MTAEAAATGHDVRSAVRRLAAERAWNGWMLYRKHRCGRWTNLRRSGWANPKASRGRSRRVCSGCAQLSSQRIRITPVASRAPHRPRVAGGFGIMAPPSGGTAAHCEHLLGQVVPDQAEDAGGMLRRFDGLQSDALSPGAAQHLSERVGGGLG